VTGSGLSEPVSAGGRWAGWIGQGLKGRAVSALHLLLEGALDEDDPPGLKPIATTTSTTTSAANTPHLRTSGCYQARVVMSRQWRPAATAGRSVSAHRVDTIDVQPLLAAGTDER